VIKDVLRVLGGGAVLYVVMAACSTSGDGNQGSGKEGNGGSTFFDALTDPVSDALAGEPQAADELCNKSYVHASSTFYYAEHLYPGKSKAQLAVVHAILTPHSGDSLKPPDYSGIMAPRQYVEDGKVAVDCGSVADATVTFVMP
jgi:hypothetical protein